MRLAKVFFAFYILALSSQSTASEKTPAKQSCSIKIQTLNSPSDLLSEAEKAKGIELLNRVQNKETKAFDELTKLYYEKILNFVRTKVDNNSDAEDITQATFIKAWNKIEQFEQNGNGLKDFNAWIFMIARNTIIDHFRKINTRPKAATPFVGDDGTELNPLDKLADQSPSPDEEAARNDQNRHLVEKIKKIMKSLPESQRRAVELESEGKSIEDIAGILKTPKSNVYVLLFRAKRRIKTLLKDQETEDVP